MNAAVERCEHCGKLRREHSVVFLRARGGIAVALECAGSRQRYRARLERPHKSAVPFLIGTALGGLPGIVFGAVVGMLDD